MAAWRSKSRREPKLTRKNTEMLCISVYTGEMVTSTDTFFLA